MTLPKPQFKSGVVHIFLILVVLAVSSAIAIYAARNILRTKAVINSPTPTGTIHADNTVVYGWGTNIQDTTIKFTATDVQGANGAQVDYVRYYLLNPQPIPWNWGQPNWCSSTSNYGLTSLGGTSCDPQGYITYDIGQSSNASNNYEIVWDKNTKSPESQQLNRGLRFSDIAAGKYTLALKVVDVNGHETGMASSVDVTLSRSQTPPPVVASPSPTANPSLNMIVYPNPVSVTMEQGSKKDALYMNPFQNSPRYFLR